MKEQAYEGGGRMFQRKKKAGTQTYDRENWKPVLKCSICNGEQVAGFKNLHTGAFREEELIRNEKELAAFKLRYGIEEMEKEY